MSGCATKCEDSLDSETCDILCSESYWLGRFVLATYFALIIAVVVLSIISVTCCCYILKKRTKKKKYTIQSREDTHEDDLVLEEVKSTDLEIDNMKEGSYDLLERPEAIPNSAPTLQDEPMEGMYDMIIDSSSSKDNKAQVSNDGYSKTKSTNNEGVPPPAPPPPPLIASSTTPQDTSAVVYASVDKTKKKKKSPLKFNIPALPTTTPTPSAVVTYEDVTTKDDYDVLHRDFNPPKRTEMNKKEVLGFYDNVSNPTTLTAPFSAFDTLYDRLTDEEIPQIPSQSEDLMNMESQYDVVNL